MKKEQFHSNTAAFSLVEVILASAVFMLLITAFVGAWIYGQESTVLAGNRARAAMLAEECLEVVRNIRDNDFNDITDGSHGLSVSGNQWTLSSFPESIGVFSRQLDIRSVNDNTKEIKCKVTWQQNLKREGEIVLITRLTNWQIESLASSCNEYAIQEGYSSGTCRQNENQCYKNNEDYLPDGNQFCEATKPPASSCCVIP